MSSVLQRSALGQIPSIHICPELHQLCGCVQKATACSIFTTLMHKAGKISLLCKVVTSDQGQSHQPQASLAVWQCPQSHNLQHACDAMPQAS